MLIDLIILVTYTITVGVAYRSDDGLGAKSIINEENPDDVEGVSKKNTFDGVFRHSNGFPSKSSPAQDTIAGYLSMHECNSIG